LNGKSVIDFKENSKTESICEFFGEIRSKKPGKKILVILDNFSSHKASATVKFAKEKGIELAYLPPYFPDLNPIELIGVSIKRIISRAFIFNLDHIRKIIRGAFQKFSSQLSFAKRGIEKFLDGDYKLEMLGF
jgi:putative transposase